MKKISIKKGDKRGNPKWWVEFPSAVTRWSENDACASFARVNLNFEFQQIFRSTYNSRLTASYLTSSLLPNVSLVSGQSPIPLCVHYSNAIFKEQLANHLISTRFSPHSTCHFFLTSSPLPISGRAPPISHAASILLTPFPCASVPWPKTSAPFGYGRRSQSQLWGDSQGIGSTGDLGLKAGGARSGQEVVAPQWEGDSGRFWETFGEEGMGMTTAVRGN